jgi:ribosome assembly protein YihI (activator of Der GTPase)
MFPIKAKLPISLLCYDLSLQKSDGRYVHQKLAKIQHIMKHLNLLTNQKTNELVTS